MSTTDFEQLFAAEIVQSERKRALVIAVFFGVAVVMTVLTVLAAPDVHFLRHFDTQARVFIPLVAGGIVLWEWLLWRTLGRHAEAGTAPRPAWRYATASVEILGISVFVALGAANINPLGALTGPPSLLYFLFIVLSGLRLDRWLCRYTGALSAVSFFAVALLFIDELRAMDPGGIYADIFPHLGRAGIYFVTGLLAGAVAEATRKRAVAAAQAAEDRREALDLFGQQVSPQVVDKLLSQGSQVISETRHVCVMFLDIRNFTRFSEMRGPQEVVDYLNTLFDALIQAVNDHGGIINKFLGDGFMAVFGAPVSDGRDSANAVTAARVILRHVDALVSAGSIPPTQVGIGLHAGEAVTGNIGSHLRREYTVIGDVVNTAARIESMNKHFDAQLLVSEVVYAAVRDGEPEAEKLEPVRVKGKSRTLQLYKLA